MKELFEGPNYSDLKREVEALRREIEDLKGGRPRPKIATRWRWLSRRSALALLAVMVAVLLALGILSAQSKRDALFIDPNGNVGIGTTDPKATLDVAGDSRFNGAVGINRGPIRDQHLVITPTQGNIPFNVTDPANSVNWLSVLSDGRVIMNGGNVGIGTTSPSYPLHLAVGKGLRIEGGKGGANYFSFGGDGTFGIDAPNVPNGRLVVQDSGNVGIKKPNPQAPLDVKGEIRGKPWHSQTFEWGKDQPKVRMTKSDHSVCFLTLVSGYFYGGGEIVEISDTGGYWWLGGAAVQRDVRAQARCIGAPDNSW